MPLMPSLTFLYILVIISLLIFSYKLPCSLNSDMSQALYTYIYTYTVELLKTYAGDVLSMENVEFPAYGNP